MSMSTQPPTVEELQQDLLSTLRDIDSQIAVIRTGFNNEKVYGGPNGFLDSVYERKDRNGMPILQPLLCAKAQVLSALVMVS